MERDPPPGADRYTEWLLATIAAGFLAIAEEHAVSGEYITAAVAMVIGIIVSIAAWRWPSVKGKINARLAKSVNLVATDGRAWFILLVALMIYMGRQGFAESIYEFWHVSTRGTFVSHVSQRGSVSSPRKLKKWSEASIKLQFNTEGTDPQEISSNNVTWKKIKLNEMMEAPCAFSLSTLNSKLGTGYSGCLTHTYVNSGAFILILYFTDSVKHRKIFIDGHGANMPDWDNTFMDSHVAVIYFHSSVENMVLDINATD